MKLKINQRYTLKQLFLTISIYQHFYLFQNPQKLPLDKLYLKVYNKYGARDIKAIDPFWVGDYSYPKYYSTPNEMNVKDIQKWLFKNNSYFEALKLFYNLPYQEFWSHVVYEPAFSIILESFLERAVPPYMLQPEHEDIVHLYSDIYSLVFAVYKRFMTFQESEVSIYLLLLLHNNV